MRPLRKAVLVIVATIVMAMLLKISPSTAVAINRKRLTESDSITSENIRNQYEELSSAESSGANVLHGDPSQSEYRRTKRTITKIKPLVHAALYPAKLVLQAGASAIGTKVHNAKVAAAGVGLHVAKVTVKAATSLGIKALLLNFLFHKINQVIDFKTRLLGNLDQKNRKQNAQFLANGQQAASSAGKGTSDGESDQQVQAQGDGEDEPVSFSPNKVSLQLPDRLFGPSFTAANGISQAIGTVIQNTATRLAKFIEALKSLLWKSSRLASNSSGSNPPDNDGATSDVDAVVGDSSDLDFVEMDNPVSVVKITANPITTTTTNASVESSTRVHYVQAKDHTST